MIDCGAIGAVGLKGIGIPQVCNATRHWPATHEGKTDEPLRHLSRQL
jgi:hypothetical protein